MAMCRSLPRFSILVVMVAMVTQPKPRTMGITALPFIPMALKVRSARVASLGR